jgi:hypothetical protein
LSFIINSKVNVQRDFLMYSNCEYNFHWWIIIKVPISPENQKELNVSTLGE